MADHHPIVGAACASLIQELIPTSTECTIDRGSHCSHCGRQLTGFVMDDGGYLKLQSDVLEKLLEPSLSKRSHYEQRTDSVLPEEVAMRKEHLCGMFDKMLKKKVDVVIDGANVGYYGVTSWYVDSKRQQLLRNAPLQAVKPTDLVMPLPIDVSPRFRYIDSVCDEVRSKGLSPMIVLHERHTVPSLRLFGENEDLLSRWRNEGLLMVSPPYLNDDFCWLYASLLKRPCYVVSNDLMRDHHFGMLSQRNFVRWRQRHRITFDILFKNVQVVLRFPEIHSTWVQNTILNRWHIPCLRNVSVIDQATNNSAVASSGGLGKDGDDRCDFWLCCEL